MGWNALFILGFIVVAVWVVLTLKKRGADKKIAAKWDPEIKKVKDAVKETVEEIKKKV